MVTIEAPSNHLLAEVRQLLLRRELRTAADLLSKISTLSRCSDNDRADIAMLKATRDIIHGRYVGDKSFFTSAGKSLEEADHILGHIARPDLRTQTIRQCVLMSRALLQLNLRNAQGAWDLFESVIEMNYTWSRERLISTFGLARIAEAKNDLQNALSLVLEGKEMMERFPALRTPESSVDLLTRLSQIYFKKQDYNQSLRYAQELLEVSRQHQAVENEIIALCDIAAIRGILGDYKTAVPMLIEAYEKSESIEFRSQTAKCLINIGTIHAQLFSHELAIERYQSALNGFSDVLGNDSRSALHNNLASIYYTLEKVPQSLEHLEKALEISQKTNHQSQTAHILSQMGRNYLFNKNFEAAEKVVEKTKNYYENENGYINQGRQIHLLNMAALAFRKDDSAAGYEFAKRGCAVARRNIDVTSELRAFEMLTEHFKQKENYRRALHCQTILAQVNQNSLRTKREMQLLSLEITFSLKEKQQQIERLTKENALQSELLFQKSQIEQQNEHLQKVNDELQQFAFITSHDLKEPLRMIKSFTQIVEKKTAPMLGDENKSHFQFINEGVTRMGNLLDALLQYATIGRAGEIEDEPLSLNVAVRAARTNLKLKIEESNANVLCGEMPVLRSKKSLLVQLFQNLISNAIKFRKPDERPIILISAEEMQSEWIIRIEDNGIGIAAAHLDRIFVIFQRLHTREQYEGTGIGLAICQKIVMQLGGRIWVESEIQKGSTFYFTLPKHADEM